MSGGGDRGGDADDAVQSAFISFWQRAEDQGFPDDLGRDDLWRLLATITLRKANKIFRRERAQKRGGGKVKGESSMAGAGTEHEFKLDQMLFELPAAEFDIYCDELFSKLDQELREFAILRLMGHSNGEIAERLGCSRRKVERKMNLIRATWEQWLE